MAEEKKKITRKKQESDESAKLDEQVVEKKAEKDEKKKTVESAEPEKKLAEDKLPEKKKRTASKMTIDKAIALIVNDEVKSIKDLKKFKKELITDILKRAFILLGLDLKPKTIKAMKWMPWEDFGTFAFEIISKVKSQLK